MSFSKPIQWYHSHVDPIWPNGGTFNPEACVLLFIYKIYVVSSKCFCCLSISCWKTVLCDGSNTCSQLMFYNLPILFGKTVLCVGPSICSIIYLFCVGRLCCVGPSICSINYLFCVGGLFCVLGPALGYNEFDFFLENKEYRPFDGCKIVI